jgi:hypothetical protein
MMAGEDFTLQIHNHYSTNHSQDLEGEKGVGEAGGICSSPFLPFSPAPLLL